MFSRSDNDRDVVFKNELLFIGFFYDLEERIKFSIPCANESSFFSIFYAGFASLPRNIGSMGTLREISAAHDRWRTG